MAIEDYWASTIARAGKDGARYFIHPVSRIAANIIFKDDKKATVIAGVTTTLFFQAITSIFMAREMDGFDQVVRPAVAAEMGKDPKDIKFSDYFDSKNPIVQARMKLFTTEDVMRYSAGMLPMLPTMMGKVSKRLEKSKNASEHNLNEITEKSQIPSSSSTFQHFVNGHGFHESAPFAAVIALWLMETFFTPKTFSYQARKEMENNESLGLKIGANNIAGLYNRMRTDAGQPMIHDKCDRERMWPLFEKLAKLVNNEKGGVGLSELTYLMGMGKLNIFVHDENGKELKDESGHRIVDKAAYENALKEIDGVAQIGLKGIVEQNRGSGHHDHSGGFVSKLGRAAMDAQFNVLTTVIGRQKSFSESISSRDPAEVSQTIP